MNYNQPFYSYGFSNGAYCNSYNSNQPNTNIAPAIIGEGDVNTVTLPDGTCQYFFTPKVKWWTLPTLNICPPLFNNTMNNNYSNPYYDSNMGVWFIRSIVNPIPPFANNICETPLRSSLRCERRSFCSDHDMNTVNPDYHLKFHHDGATSTTDIHYFYPCLRQYDCTFNFPPKSCAGVQIDTPPVNMCQYKPANSKPCDCTSQEHHSLEPSNAMSAEINHKSKDNACDCHSLDVDSCHKEQRQIIPTDGRRKRIKLEKKSPQKNRAKVTCECPAQSVDKSTGTYMECGCEANPESDLDMRNQKTRLNKKLKKQLKHNKDEHKVSNLKDFNCECIPPHFSKKFNISESDRIEEQSCCDRSSNVLDANILLCEDTNEM